MKECDVKWWLNYENMDLSHIHLAVKPSAEEVNDMSKSCMFGSGNIGSLCMI